jgi:hypothetical protein
MIRRSFLGKLLGGLALGAAPTWGPHEDEYAYDVLYGSADINTQRDEAIEYLEAIECLQRLKDGVDRDMDTALTLIDLHSQRQFRNYKALPDYVRAQLRAHDEESDRYVMERVTWQVENLLWAVKHKRALDAAVAALRRM